MKTCELVAKDYDGFLAGQLKPAEAGKAATEVPV